MNEGLSASRSLLDQQSPGLEKGFTNGQEAAYIASEWGIYSDMKGRASYLLKAFAEEIRRLENEVDRLRCAAGLGRSYGLDCDKLEGLS